MKDFVEGNNYRCPWLAQVFKHCDEGLVGKGGKSVPADGDDSGRGIGVVVEEEVMQGESKRVKVKLASVVP